MAAKIKLQRIGKVRNAQYRIIVADARTRRSGRAAAMRPPPRSGNGGWSRANMACAFQRWSRARTYRNC